MALFTELNEVYASFFSEPFPVRTTVGVASLPKGALVEMDATVPLTAG
jgi:2-iminobutanoate/2-iminopropanoate deaminase